MYLCAHFLKGLEIGVYQSSIRTIQSCRGAHIALWRVSYLISDLSSSIFEVSMSTIVRISWQRLLTMPLTPPGAQVC